MLSKDRIGALLLLAFSSAYWYYTYQIRMLPFQRDQAFNAQTMPEALAVMGVVLSLALIIFPSDRSQPDLKGYQWLTGFTMLVLMFLYGITLRPLGFISSTSLFLMGGYLALGERNVLKLVLASVPISVGFWALMSYGLDIYVEPLPSFLRERG